MDELYEIYKKIRLENIIVESFNDVKKKWLIMNTTSSVEIDDYFKRFKLLNDRNQIPKNQNDISVWTKKTFSDFKTFVETLEYRYMSMLQLKNDLKTTKNISKEDIIIVLNNKNFMIVVPKEYNISREIGSPAWCISYGETYWDDYVSKNGLTPYFIIPKKYMEFDGYNLSKFCVMISLNDSIHSIWDADDEKIINNTFIAFCIQQGITLTDTSLFASRVYECEEEGDTQLEYEFDEDDFEDEFEDLRLACEKIIELYENRDDYEGEPDWEDYETLSEKIINKLSRGMSIMEQIYFTIQFYNEEGKILKKVCENFDQQLERLQESMGYETITMYKIQ